MPDEYEAIVEQARAGTLLVGVDRQYARMLFTDVPLSQLEATSDASLRGTKIVALACFVGAPLLVLTAGVLSVITGGWWSILWFPLLLFGWLAFKSSSVRGRAHITGITAVLLAAAVWVAFLDARTLTHLLVLTFLGGLWLERFLYVFTTSRFRTLVLKHRKAMEAFQEGLSFRPNSGVSERN